MKKILLLIILCVSLGFLLPGVIASWRDHKNELGVWLVNILLGWTGLGWIIGLIWSVMN